MAMTLEDLRREILNLSEDVRLELIEDIMSNFSHDIQPEIEEAWRQESNRRLDAILSGTVEMRSASDVLKDLQAMI